MEGAVRRAFFVVNPAAEGWPLVVAVGGDGTPNEVVKGLAHNADESVWLALSA